MDFIESLRQFSARAEKMKPQIQSEEATKTSLVMPFFQQVFGYDVFNPNEFVPEFTADVGIKKGEKVDYAIFLEGEPVILVEAKWCGTPLEKHYSQLFRYFGTTNAKFGILTNGIVYKFYTDLEEQNKMDLKPFLELNLSDIKESLVPNLKRFCKSNFDADELFSCASELKYSNEIRGYFSEQLRDPSDEFVRFILAQTYDGLKTQAVIDKFKPIVKNTLNNYINELMNEKITSALKKEASDSQEQTSPAVEAEKETKPKIITTDEEIEAFGKIKGLLHGVLDPSSITYRDTESYFAVLFKGKVKKWICRLTLDRNRKILIITSEADTLSAKDLRIPLDSTDDLYKHKDLLLASAKRFAKPSD